LSVYPAVTLTLGIWALLGFVASITLLGTALRPAGREWLRHTMGGDARSAIAGAWVVALVAMAGSLYFSDVVGFTPCLLCWDQRILMYPLVVLLGVALWLREPGAWRITIGLPLLGLVIATYHVALQYRPSLGIVACDEGVPCSGRYLAVFGFISIPMMAAFAFLLIVALLVVAAVAQGPEDASVE
jgi:disulfide bond formation protein DsbB